MSGAGAGRQGGFPRRELPAVRRAAVALAVLPHRGEDVLVVTGRSLQLRAHAAQYSLPGGMLEEGETVVAAALRETEEELGISPDSWDVGDLLDDVAVSGQLVISPVVLRAREQQVLRPNPAEVAQVHLAVLPTSPPELEWVPAADQPFAHPDAAPARAVTLGELQLFAPTGAVVYQFLHWHLTGVVRRVDDFRPAAFAAGRSD